MESVQINHDKIAYEEIDGEVLIIDVQTGNYYSLSPTGTLVWRALAADVPTEQICVALANAYDSPQEDIRAAVAAFLGELAAEEMISPREGTAVSGEPYSLPAADEPFVPPAVTKYTNMSDLLLLDPIHDVDESGWPQQKQD